MTSSRAGGRRGSLGQRSVGAVSEAGDDAVLVDVRVDVRRIDELLSTYSQQVYVQ